MKKVFVALSGFGLSVCLCFVSVLAHADTTVIPIVQAWMAPLAGTHNMKGDVGCEAVEIVKNQIEPNYEIYEVHWSKSNLVAMYYVYEKDAVGITKSSLDYKFNDGGVTQESHFTKNSDGTLKTLAVRMARNDGAYNMELRCHL